MKIKNVNDYVDSVHEKFPELTRDEVKKTLVYGWKMIIQYVSAGNDVSIITPKEFMFIGKIPSSALTVFKNNISLGGDYNFEVGGRLQLLGQFAVDLEYVGEYEEDN